MKTETCDEDMLGNYDFTGGVRGKYAHRYGRAHLELPVSEPSTPDSALFEQRARRVLSRYYDVELAPGSVAPVHKRFNLVSPDGQVVGDARYFPLIAGSRRPSAKLAAISEYVWLLEKTQAPKTFLVFGNDLRVPSLWLRGYGNLLNGVKFYFLDDDDRLQQLSSLHKEL